MIDTFSSQAIANAFKEIDKDNDGFISRQDLLNTDYAVTLFEESPALSNAFDCFSDGKMNFKDFSLLVHAVRYKLTDLAISKFKAEKYLNKYLTVSAPGQPAPSLKKSFIDLKAYVTAKKEEKVHSLGVEFGIDKPNQQKMIKEVSKVLGHPLHQAFLLIKFITPKNGEEIAKRLVQVLQNTLEILKALAPEVSETVSALKPYAKYANNCVYIVIQVDNPLIDGLIAFATEFVQSISPKCALLLKAKIQSNLGNLLTESFDYTKSEGQASIEFDIDHVTLKKVKEILVDYIIDDEDTTPIKQLLTVLLEEVKISAQFTNLGEAIASLFSIQPSEIPKPFSKLEFVKELNIKETLGQLYEGGPDLLQLISYSSLGQGQISINIHDIFAKITYDVHLEKAFQLLG